MTRIRKFAPFLAGHFIGFVMGCAYVGFMIGAGWLS